MILADTWYTSSTTWAIAGVVVALLVGVVASWVAWRAANPRRRLVYAMGPASRLVNTDRLLGNLEVRRNGTVLSNPYVVTVTLANRGRFDVSKGAFEDRPLRFDLGTAILEVLDVSGEPAQFKAPEVAWTGDALLVGPDKIGRGQRVTISLLVDGNAPALTCRDDPLIDVELRQEREVTSRLPTRVVLTVLLPVATMIAAASLFQFAPPSPASTPGSPTSTGSPASASFVTPDGRTKVAGKTWVQIKLTDPPPSGEGGVWLILEPLSDDKGMSIAPAGLDYLIAAKTSLEDDNPNLVNGIWANTVQIGTPRTCGSTATESLYAVLVGTAEDTMLRNAAAADTPVRSLPGKVLAQANVQRDGRNC